MVRSLDDCITFWNKGAEHLYGWTREEAFGNNCHQLLRTQFPKPLDEIREYFLKYGSWQGELTQFRKDGTSAHIFSRWTLIRRGSSAARIFEISNDISGKLELEAQFLHAQKMESVGRLASGVANDFNNLLTVVISRSEIVMNALEPG